MDDKLHPTNQSEKGFLVIKAVIQGLTSVSLATDQLFTQANLTAREQGVSSQELFFWPELKPSLKPDLYPSPSQA